MLTLLFIGCALEPEVKTVFKDRIVEVETVYGDVPLLYAEVRFWEGYSDWKNANGITAWFVVYNPTDEDWYGHPEIRIYSTSEFVESDSTFENEDLIYKGQGILTTDLEYNLSPVDTLNYVPGNGYRYALVFVEIDYDELQQYYYALVRMTEQR
jgi:hypothetical protein